MNFKTSSTPTPWKQSRNRVLARVDSTDDVVIATCGTQPTAELIVRACNAHDDLVWALQNLVNGIQSGAIVTEYDETMEHAVIKAHDALRKARGEA